MNEYRIVACISGFIVYDCRAPMGSMQSCWAFTTAVEAADKLLELMQKDESE